MLRGESQRGVLRSWVIWAHRQDLLKKGAEYLDRNCELWAVNFEPSQFMNRQEGNQLVWNVVPSLGRHNYLTIPDYNILRIDRLRRKGGGVCLYVHKNNEVSIIQPRIDIVNCTEILWLKCILNGIVYYVTRCYNTPKAVYKSDVFVSELSKDIEQIATLPVNSTVVVAVDFNGHTTDYI